MTNNKIQNKYFKKKVKAIEVNNTKKISELLSEMAQTGFQGKKLAQTVDVWEKMFKDPEATIIMGYTGSLSTTGQWKIVNWLIENRFIDVLVPTGANISEDIVDAMGFGYWQGHHVVDDHDLLENDINRYYDVFGSEIDYVEMIELIADGIMALKEGYHYTTREFLYEIGKYLSKKGIKSIVATAAEHKVPIYCPAIVDSPYGDAALVAKAKGFNLILDSVKDFSEFMGLAQKIKTTGVVYIGGGVPKDFIQLLAVTSPLQFKDRIVPGKKGGVHRTTKEGYYPHKYAIQITTDSPQWGGLSGCTFEEASSWGKEIIADSNTVQCYVDATIALPLVSHALCERVKMKRNGTDFSFLFNGKKA